MTDLPPFATNSSDLGNWVVTLFAALLALWGAIRQRPPRLSVRLAVDTHRGEEWLMAVFTNYGDLAVESMEITGLFSTKPQRGEDPREVINSQNRSCYAFQDRARRVFQGRPAPGDTLRIRLERLRGFPSKPTPDPCYLSYSYSYHVFGRLRAKKRTRRVAVRPALIDVLADATEGRDAPILESPAQRKEQLEKLDPAVRESVQKLDADQAVGIPLVEMDGHALRDHAALPPLEQFSDVEIDSQVQEVVNATQPEVIEEVSSLEMGPLEHDESVSAEMDSAGLSEFEKLVLRSLPRSTAPRTEVVSRILHPAAGQSGVSPRRVNEAINRLVDLGYLEVRDGRLRRLR